MAQEYKRGKREKPEAPQRPVRNRQAEEKSQNQCGKETGQSNGQWYKSQLIGSFHR
jgi:hypothetical protein